jgi:uncharacterized protein
MPLPPAPDPLPPPPSAPEIAPSPPAQCLKLLLFTRYPVAGHTKTRLIPHLGAAGAAALQQRLSEHVIARSVEAAQWLPLAVEVQFSGGSQAQMQAWLNPSPTRSPPLTYRAQAEGNLGDRLAAAFSQAFAEGHSGAIAIGSDCPALGLEHFTAAVTSLQRRDMVIGPATDGGYYLIGLRRPAPALFEGIPWGSGQVLAQTLVAAQTQGLSVAQLSPLSDIDRPEDLPQWENIVQQRWPPCP